MSILQWGIILDFLGSLLLTLHIFGVERIRKFEQNILNFPDIAWNLLQKRLFSRLFLGFFSSPYNRDQKLRTVVMHLIRKKNAGNSGSESTNKPDASDWLLITPILKSLIVMMPLIIDFWAIAFVPFIVVRVFLFLQKLSKADNFFGFTGLLLLATGFMLQFLSTLK